jgi:ribosomal protein L11 methyltransferase
MNYYELKITLSPNTEVSRDILSALLVDLGFESFVESETGLDAYVPENFYSAKRIAALLQSQPLLNTTIEYHTELIPSQDWNEEWEKNFFQPIIIDEQVVIHSSFHHDVPTLSYDIVIDPKMAFGTGHHSTTSLMVSFLLELELAGKSFLDMGCGTAVLAILAALRGAKPVTGIDIDEWAVANALENSKLNNTPAINIQLGDASLLGNEKYDLIFANINRNILIRDIPIYKECLLLNGSLYMSGFYVEDLAIIKEKCAEHGLRFISYKEDKDWCAAHFAL